LDRAKAAYLLKWLKRILIKKLQQFLGQQGIWAVRIFTEEIATTKGDFDMLWVTVPQIDHE